MVRKLVLGAVGVGFVATAAIAAPTRPEIVLPADLLPTVQTVPTQSVPEQANGTGQQAQEDQTTPEPARRTPKRRSGFFGLPLALLLAGAGGAAAAVATASPQ